MRSYPGPIFPPDHPTGHPGPWRHGDRDEDQGSRSEEPEEREGHEEAGGPDPPIGDQPSAEDEEGEEDDIDRDDDEENEDVDEDEDDEEEEDRDEEESDAALHHSGDDTIALDPSLFPKRGNTRRSEDLYPSRIDHSSVGSLVVPSHRCYHITIPTGVREIQLMCRSGIL
ncbi:histone chaperone ASF1-like [Cryptomeria japonica]|uniref:histone chaperone ASF1-like n=1 Tax=Cryptomeria japonica TaxID=3369 RepID=UPI0027D9E879|nr:histone chaperone ASF1-like [Cryptomeria japonica]